MAICKLLPFCVLTVVTTGVLSGNSAFVTAIKKSQKLASAGQLQVAVALLEGTLEQDTAGVEVRTVAVAWNELGKLYTDTGRPLEAQKALRRSVKLFEDLCGAGCLDTVAPRINLARVYAAQRDLPRAQNLLEGVLETGLALTGGSHPALAPVYINLANVHFQRSHLKEAEHFASRAIALMTAAADQNLQVIASARNLRAMLKAKRGDESGAIDELRETIEALEEHLANDHPTLLPYLINLGDVYLTSRRWKEAEGCLTRALAIVESKSGQGHPYQATALALLAEVYRETGRRAEAKRALQSARSIYAGYRARNQLDGLVSVDDLQRRH